MKSKQGRQQKPKVKERDIEKSILDFLTMFPNVQARKAHTTGMYDPSKELFRPLQGHSLRGVSDIALIIRVHLAVVPKNTKSLIDVTVKAFGIAGAIEVKTPEGLQQHLRYTDPKYQPTSHTRKAWVRARDQQAYVDMVNAWGGVAGFATSIEDVQKLLKGYL